MFTRSSSYPPPNLPPPTLLPPPPFHSFIFFNSYSPSPLSPVSKFFSSSIPPPPPLLAPSFTFLPSPLPPLLHLFHLFFVIHFSSPFIPYPSLFSLLPPSYLSTLSPSLVTPSPHTPSLHSLSTITPLPHLILHCTPSLPSPLFNHLILPSLHSISTYPSFTIPSHSFTPLHLHLPSTTITPLSSPPSELGDHDPGHGHVHQGHHAPYPRRPPQPLRDPEVAAGSRRVPAHAPRYQVSRRRWRGR